ncbi:MAG: hypothetical protein OHK0013_28180 [Sandaracinaceae bacterium]
MREVLGDPYVSGPSEQSLYLFGGEPTPSEAARTRVHEDEGAHRAPELTRPAVRRPARGSASSLDVTPTLCHHHALAASSAKPGACVLSPSGADGARELVRATGMRST